MRHRRPLALHADREPREALEGFDRDYRRPTPPAKGARRLYRRRPLSLTRPRSFLQPLEGRMTQQELPALWPTTDIAWQRERKRE
ncbi:hypothetical protein AJ87_36020 [Rhizobium yanglingense]|nr:hypothetical protein AJ87_36020 [Rhizobium yanglingense]